MTNTKPDSSNDELNTKLPQEKKSKEDLREAINSTHEDLHKTSDDDLRK